MDTMNAMTDDGSFMFTSESVGEGHPGESLISQIICTLYTFSICVVIMVPKSCCNFGNLLTCVATHVQTDEQLLADTAV